MYSPVLAQPLSSILHLTFPLVKLAWEAGGPRLGLQMVSISRFLWVWAFTVLAVILLFQVTCFHILWPLNCKPALHLVSSRRAVCGSAGGNRHVDLTCVERWVLEEILTMHGFHLLGWLLSLSSELDMTFYLILVLFPVHILYNCPHF